MNERIDDIFRDNIDNRSFDYQDDFWDDIAAELDAKEDKKKRPFFWIVTGITLPFFFLAMAYFFAPYGEVQTANTEVVPLVFDDEKTEQIAPKRLVEKTIVAKIETEVNEAFEKIEKPVFIESNAPVSDEILIDILDKKVEKIGLQKKQSKNVFNEKVLPAFAENSIDSEKEILVQKSDNQVVVTKNDLTVEATINSIFDKKTIEKSTPSPYEIIKDTNNSTTDFLTKTNSNSEIKSVEIEVLKTEKPTMIRTVILELSSLGKRPEALLEIPEKEAPSFEKQIIPSAKYFNPFWNFGLTANAGADNHKNQFSNWSAGTFSDYRFAKKWSLETSILYGEFSGNFGTSATSLQTTYGFGRSRQMQKLIPEKLSLLQLPMTLNFYQKRHQFGFGIQAEYLLAVQGEKQVFKEEASRFARVSSESGVLTKPTELPGLNAAILLGYDYNFPRFSVGMRGRYYLKNYLPAIQPTDVTKDLMMMDLVLKINL